MCEAADEVEARQQLSTAVGAAQIRMVVEHTGIEHRDDHARGAHFAVPGADGVHRGHLGVLADTTGWRTASRSGSSHARNRRRSTRHVFNRRVRPQPLEHLRGARITELNRAGQHEIGNLALESERESRALGERGCAVGAVASLAMAAPAPSLRSLTMTPRFAGVSRMRGSCDHRIVFGVGQCARLTARWQSRAEAKPSTIAGAWRILAATAWLRQFCGDSGSKGFPGSQDRNAPRINGVVRIMYIMVNYILIYGPLGLARPGRRHLRRRPSSRHQ